MHVLVTGATGFVGLHTALALVRAGHTVRLGARNREKLDRVYATHGIDPTDYHIADITDETAMSRALDGCDGVVHTAALVSLDPTDAQCMHEANVLGTRTVIGGAVNRGLESIVYVSSAAALFTPGLQAIDESTPLAAAQSAYGASKAAADNYVRSLVADGANIATTYPTGVLGPDDPGRSEGNRGVEFILNCFHIHTSSGIQLIDVRDLAAIHVGLLERKCSGPYVCAGHYSEWKEFGRMLEHVTGRRLLKLPIPGPAMRAMGILADWIPALRPSQLPMSREAMNLATRWAPCDDSKLRGELGLAYRPLEESLSDTVRWMAETGVLDKKWADKVSNRFPNNLTGQTRD